MQLAATETNFHELTLLDVSENFKPLHDLRSCRPYTHPPWDSEDHGPGRAFRPTPAPLEPSGQPGLTRLRPSTPR